MRGKVGSINFEGGAYRAFNSPSYMHSESHIDMEPRDEIGEPLVPGVISNVFVRTNLGNTLDKAHNSHFSSERDLF